MVLIAPSILSADFLRLGEEIKALEQAGANLIHIDVMDGHFVPNLTLGPVIIKAIKQATSLPLDVHLMITNADCYLDNYIDAGADQLTIHAEASLHLERSIKAIKSRGIKAGLSLNPATSEEALRYLIDDIDLVLVMSVNPGFSGQTFIESSLKKIMQVKKMIDHSTNKNCVIAVDGGINEQTIKPCFQAGATCFIAGSHIFAQNDYAKAISRLREQASSF